MVNTLSFPLRWQETSQGESSIIGAAITPELLAYLLIMFPGRVIHYHQSEERQRWVMYWYIQFHNGDTYQHLPYNWLAAVWNSIESMTMLISNYPR